ncbi:hypothetical protein EDD15DRAFT_341806 [Pisolithus albus]|nr:hypothetical protein EDD15DRAFT_341806 [Pisolithus albus]
MSLPFVVLICILLYPRRARGKRCENPFFRLSAAAWSFFGLALGPLTDISRASILRCAFIATARLLGIKKSLRDILCEF